MPRFSLIVPTLGRTTEVAKLFASIVDQGREDVEVIVVDQNDDERVFRWWKLCPAVLPSRT